MLRGFVAGSGNMLPRLLLSAELLTDEGLLILPKQRPHCVLRAKQRLIVMLIVPWTQEKDISYK
jgi:hypothetical protein